MATKLKDPVSCCSCGYTWERYQDGTHSCSTHLRKLLNEVLRAIPAIRAARDPHRLKVIQKAKKLVTD